MAYDQSLCGDCHRPMAETMAVEADDAYDTVVLRCHACAARERAGRKFTEDGNADTAGLRIAITDGTRFYDDDES
jgi:RNase P subunit RPR2